MRSVLGWLKRLVREVFWRVQGPASGRARPPLVLVTGVNGWVVDEIALGITPHLSQWYDVRIVESLGWVPMLLDTNVHYLTRTEFFLPKGLADIHPSNRVIVTWQHGGPGSVNPDLVSAAAGLARNWRAAARLTVPNSRSLESVVECGVERDAVRVVPNPIRLAAFPPANAARRREVREQLGIPLDAFVVGSFQRDGADDGTPKLEKGPDILVRVLAAANQAEPLYVLLTGSGRRYVRERLSELGVAHGHQWVDPYERITDMYASADAYLITSREEGGPLGLLEAMASGVPVISTRMGMAVDLGVHEQNCLLSDVDDAAGLTANLQRLRADQILRERLTSNASETVRDYDVAVVARRFRENAYEGLFT